MCHAETSPHAAWLIQSRDDQRDHGPSSLKGKLVATFLRGSCMCGMAVLVLVPSIHPPVVLLEWVAIFSGQQSCSDFSSCKAVGFIRRYCFSLGFLSPCTLSMMLAELQKAESLLMVDRNV